MLFSLRSAPYIAFYLPGAAASAAHSAAGKAAAAREASAPAGRSRWYRDIMLHRIGIMMEGIHEDPGIEHLSVIARMVPVRRFHRDLLKLLRPLVREAEYIGVWSTL